MYHVRQRGTKAPEIYARPNDEVYVCGGTDGEPLPDMTYGTKAVKVSSKACEALFEQARQHSSRS